MLVTFFFITCHVKVYYSHPQVQGRLLPHCDTFLTVGHALCPADSCWGLRAGLVGFLINRRELAPHRLPSEMLAEPVRPLVMALRRLARNQFKGRVWHPCSDGSPTQVPAQPLLLNPEAISSGTHTCHSSLKMSP